MKPIEIASSTSERARREPSVCESCGAEFACGTGAAGCWCFEIKLSDETRAGLRSRFSSCLCRACLESFAAQEADADAHRPS